MRGASARERGQKYGDRYPSADLDLDSGFRGHAWVGLKKLAVVVAVLLLFPRPLSFRRFGLVFPSILLPTACCGDRMAESVQKVTQILAGNRKWTRMNTNGRRLDAALTR